MEKQGLKVLSDSELLAVIPQKGTKQENAIQKNSKTANFDKEIKIF